MKKIFAGVPGVLRCSLNLGSLLILTMLFGLPRTVDAVITVTDDRGRELRLEHSAGRIVSLAPHVTELAYAAGAGDRLVGVSAFSDYPAAAARLPRVGGGWGIDVERVLALHPDLVIAWGSGNPILDIEKLERLGLKVFVTEPRHLVDIPATLLKFGELAGSGAAARKAAAGFTRELEALRVRYRERRPVRLFFQISQRPLMTLSGAHIVNDVLRLCGGENIFDDLADLAPVVGMEDVLERAPEVILLSTAVADAPGVAREWRRRSALPAAKGGHVYTIPADLIVRHTPRILQGARMICEKLDLVRKHP